MYHDAQHQSTKLPLFARIGQVAGEGGDLEVPGFRTVCSEWPICGTGYTVNTASEPPVFKFIRVYPVYSHNYGWETGDLNKPSTTNNVAAGDASAKGSGTGIAHSRDSIAAPSA